MKTAIVCDWLVTYAGSERVLGEIIQCFPEADLFAVVDFLPEESRRFLLGKSPKTTFIQKLPFAKQKYRSYLPLMPKAIEGLDVSGYDLVISSSHAVAKGVRTSPQQIHISYVHTPMRYAWDLKDQYLKESGLNKGLKGLVAKHLLNRLRAWDHKTAENVNHFIANSHYIANRILNAYQRGSRVIYPPVNIEHFKPHFQKEDYYLTASRMVPYKKIDLIVESFAKMPDKRLVIIGNGPDMPKIKAKATSNIEILGHQTPEALLSYMQHAKAFVFAAEEDFGIVAVEAQACGTPVIAFGKGGALETIKGLDQEKPTGVFFNEQTPSSLIAAIQTFEACQDRIPLENCVEQAFQFRPERFREEFMNMVETACE